MDDLISRREAIDALCEEPVMWLEDDDYGLGLNNQWHYDVNALKKVPSAQRWIPIKTRPMTEEERQYWEEHFGMQFDDEDAVIFDCPMPEDGQCVWLTTKNGYLFQDVVENDDGMIGLEGNGDWDDIIAWMPVYKPEPYEPPKEETQCG